MADNISNEYSMISILQDIGSNFFPEDLSNQRIGMFGFLTESQARIFGATILDSNMRANEYHTITAKKMDTLLYDASILGVDVENTRPSDIVVYLAFDVSLMHRTEYCNPDDPNPDHKTYYFLIEKDMIVNISGFEFMPEWDILVTAQWNTDSNDYTYAARYMTEGDVDPHNNDMCSDYVYIKEDTLSNMTTKYIQGTIVKAGNTKLFMMRLNLRQMSKKYEYYTVIENDVITLTGIEFQFEDFLSHFNVYYRENQSSEWEYVKPISVYDSSEYPEKTIQYQIDKDAKLIILNATQFEMKYNSELRIDIYTTKGSYANFNYSGDGSDIFVELKSYDDRHVYTGISMMCLPITSSKFGQNTSSIDEVRNKVIIAKGSREALSTEYDLYNFMNDRDILNDYFFIKKRSDILEHIYAMFTVLRNESGEMIPTSTLDLILPINEDKNNGVMMNEEILSIKAGTPFVINTNKELEEMAVEYFGLQLDPDNIENDRSRFLTSVYNRVKINDGKETIMENNEIVKQEANMKIFAAPYTIAYDLANQLSSLYMTSISDRVIMGFDDIYDRLHDYDYPHFNIDHINISRNSFIGENCYHVKVSVMANSNYNFCQNKNGDSKNVNRDDYANALMLKGFIYNKESDNTTIDGSDYVSAYFNFQFDSFSDGVFEFSADIQVDDSLIVALTKKMFSNDYMYSLRDPKVILDEFGKITTDNSKEITNVIPNKSVPIDIFNMRLGIGVYYLSERLDKTGTVSAEFIESDIGADAKYEYAIINDGTDGRPIIPFPIFKNNGYRIREENNQTIEEPKEVKYILTDYYTNNSDLIDLYVDMSYLIRCNSDKITLFKYSDGTYDANPNKEGVDPVYKVDEETGEIKTDHEGNQIRDTKAYIYFHDVPLIQFSKAIDITTSERIANIITETKEYLDEINSRLDNSFSIDYKFFRTYGPCQYFKLEKTNNTNRELLDSLDISIELNARLKPGITNTDSDVITQLKQYIKTAIEKLNSDDEDYSIYMSNITTELENNFKNILKSIDLVKLSKRDDYRVLFYDKPDISAYSAIQEGRTMIKNYIPEYINLPLENIKINIIR